MTESTGRTPTRTMYRMRVALCVIGLAGCSENIVELAEPARLEASTDPTTIGSINEQVSAIAVDQARLYWMGIFTPWNGGDGSGVALHSCLKDHCSDSLVTFDRDHVDLTAGFVVHEGEIYWRRQESFLRVGPTNSTIVACRVSGCAGAPRTVFEWTEPFGSIVPGPDGIYFQRSIYIDDQQTSVLQRVPFAGAAEPTTVLTNDSAFANLLLSDSEAFWFEPPYGDTNLAKVRLSDATHVEIVAKSVRVSLGLLDAAGWTPPYQNLALDPAHVYWTDNTLAGMIMRCPTSGCVGEPEKIAGPIRKPTTLRIDGGHGYFQYQATDFNYALARCPIENCEKPETLAEGLNASNVIAIDDRWVYTATTDHDLNPAVYWDQPNAQILRFPK